MDHQWQGRIFTKDVQVSKVAAFCNIDSLVCNCDAVDRWEECFGENWTETQVTCRVGRRAGPGTIYIWNHVGNSPRFSVEGSKAAK